jgi:hypothetical protein
MGETLTDGEKTSLEKPLFNWKYVQQPIRYDGDVEVMNSNADKEEQLVDLAQYLAGKAMRGLRIKLEKMFANGGSTTTTLYNDTGKNFNSLVHALKHVAAVENYGALSRGYTPGTRNWWQGADQGTGGASQIVQNIASGTSWTSYQGTATTLSIAALRSWVIPIQHSIKAKRDIMFVMCPTLYNKLKAECQAMMIYEPDKGDDVAKVGFNRMYIDGHQIVDWDYLETNTTMDNWVFGLNLETWELHYNKARNFKMTKQIWAAELPNGGDYFLRRIMLAGNLCCSQPNANILLTAVS